MISSGLLILASACNNSETKKAEADTTAAVAPAPDTTAAVAPVEADPAVDSAAITKEYLAARKSTKAPKAKKQGTNDVVMYSESPMPTHEALEQPAIEQDPLTIDFKKVLGAGDRTCSSEERQGGHPLTLPQRGALERGQYRHHRLAEDFRKRDEHGKQIAAFHDGSRRHRIAHQQP